MHSRFLFVVIFVILVLSSAFLRFTNLHWDAGNRIHPDEALIVNGANSIQWVSNLNPNFHDYNGFPVYLLSSVSQLTKHVSIEDMTIVGRYLSAFISSISVLLFYFMVIKLFPPTIALASATAFSFSPLLIQLAHFYTTDSILVFLLILLLFCMYNYSVKPTIKNLIFLSIPLGFSIATKNTGYLFIPLPLMMLLFSKQSINQKLAHATLLIATTIALFFLTSPYSFLNFSGYLSRSKYLSDVVSGKLSFDWTVQFLETTPWYWFIQTIYAFGPLAIAGPIGIGLLINNQKQEKRKSFLLPVSFWTIGFMIFLSITYLKFIRYNAPLVPLYSLGFGYLLSKFTKQPIAVLLIHTLLIVQILYGTMFFSIYTTPHTSLKAAEWITINIPNTSNLLREEWNNIIRYDKEPLAQKNLLVDSINFYTLPDKNKIDTIIEKILANDYIILDSPKVRNTMRRLSDRYPYSSAFYDLLENGALGFIKIAEFNSYPRIGATALNDENAEETFTIFDHPTVRIYKKLRQLTEKEISFMLTSEIR